MKFLTKILVNFIHGKNNYAGSAVRCVIISHGMVIILPSIGGLSIEFSKTNHNTRIIR